MMTRETSTPPYWMGLALAASAAIAVYAQLFPALIREWLEFPSLSHGFAIPVIAAYLLWARRERLRGVLLDPSAWGIPVLLFGLAAFVVGVRGDEPFVARLSLPVTLLGISLFLGGRRLTSITWVGIAYLLFMVPLPYETLKLITYRSRLLDAGISAAALGWLGVPIYREGVLLHLPNMTLEVADECSSIPAIAALMSLGVAYAVTAGRPVTIQAVLIASSLPFAITANIVRITSTAVAVYYIGPWTLRTFYHQFNGTVNFLLTFLFLLLLDRVLMSWLGRSGRR